MKQPSLIKGGKAEDSRGKIVFVNDFDMTEIKRFYQISNHDISFKRGWQGHNIEQRWFQVTTGNIEIRLIAFKEYTQGEPVMCHIFTLSDKEPTVLHVPSGYVSCIQAKTEDNGLAVFSDYAIGAVNDEIRFDSEHFKNIIEIYK